MTRLRPRSRALVAEAVATDIPIVPLPLRNTPQGSFNGRAIRLMGWRLSEEPGPLFRTSPALPNDPASRYAALFYVHERTHQGDKGEQPWPTANERGALGFRAQVARDESIAFGPTRCMLAEEKLDHPSWYHPASVAIASAIALSRPERMTAFLSMFLGASRMGSSYIATAREDYRASQYYDVAPPGGW